VEEEEGGGRRKEGRTKGRKERKKTGKKEGRKEGGREEEEKEKGKEGRKETASGAKLRDCTEGVGSAQLTQRLRAKIRQLGLILSCGKPSTIAHLYKTHPCCCNY